MHWKPHPLACGSIIIIVVAFVSISNVRINTDQWQPKAFVVYLRHDISIPHVTSHRHSHFIEATVPRADSDGYIILAMTDEAFTDMAINFYEASLRAHRIHNFLFVGVGRKTCKILANKRIPCFHYADDPSADEPSDFGKAEFNRKVNIRTRMILYALAANFTVINTDVDVAFLHNPLPQLKVSD